MKEILASFDRSLQMAAGAKEIMKKDAKPVDSGDKKDDSLPLPKFMITGGQNIEAVAVPTKIESVKVKSPLIKVEVPPSDKNTELNSSLSPAVDEKEKEKEAPPTRRNRTRTNPKEDIVRSSKQALPRRRFVQEDVGNVPYNFSNMNNFTGMTQDLTYDGMITNMPFNKTQPVSQLDYYGFPDISNTLNVDINTMNFNNNALSPVDYSSAAATPELIDCGIDASLGVYSSPIAPLTPPTGSFSISNNIGSPYTMQDQSYYTPEPLTYGSWSGPSSGVGSPLPQQSLSPQPMPAALQSLANIEMKRHILVPLAGDHILMIFAPLIASASHRLDEGRILCLRDLEKFLLFKCQEMALTPQESYIFCERLLLRCQSAIPYIENVGGELTRPNDVPYYEGYFLDVLAQHKASIPVQQQQQQIAPAAPVTIMRRETQPSTSTSKKSMSSNSRVSKNHSVSHISHASISAGMHEQILAELIQQASQDVKMGLASSFADSYQIAPQSGFPLSPESEDQGGQDLTDEDEGSPANVSSSSFNYKKKRLSVQKPLGGHVCMHRDEETGAICGKKYNRPCDLKKHGKTHSRPHKCSEPTCLYHDKGFPTEKERDRHETDRHSDSPHMFHCEFPPCPYKSKRESNCKQHMEKQHDYVYERSKHNPRNPNGNADVAAKRTSMSKAAAGDGTTTTMPSMKTDGGISSVFDNGMSTPPHDYASGFFPTPGSMTNNDMSKVQNMYLTPSPENSQTFRSGSVSTIGEPDAEAVYTDNWNQFGAWQQQPMNSFSYNMAGTE